LHCTTSPGFFGAGSSDGCSYYLLWKGSVFWKGCGGEGLPSLFRHYVPLCRSAFPLSTSITITIIIIIDSGTPLQRMFWNGMKTSQAWSPQQPVSFTRTTPLSFQPYGANYMHIYSLWGTKFSITHKTQVESLSKNLAKCGGIEKLRK